jgi:hypothetical protein
MEGRTLGDWIRETGALPTGDALTVVECVADALRYAWDKGRIIHCDIKPDNIFVDSDGTIRVADLGLARTMNRISHKPDSDFYEVIGTPWYMSPEQAAGETDLDCRADMYSLGATFYHMITGRLLFAGYPEEQVVDLQQTETVADPADINPKIQRGVCSLVEKMLAKDRNRRHPDWDSVLADVKRVRKGLLPQDCLEGEKESTVRRSPLRHTTKVILTPKSEPGLLATTYGRVSLIAGVCVLGLVVWWGCAQAAKHRRLDAERLQQQQEAAKRIERIYTSAENWAAANPDQYDQAIERFRQALPQLKGSKHESPAEARLRTLENARKEEVLKVLAGLQTAAAPLLAKGEFAQAAALYESYAGRLASETEPERKSTAKRLRERESVPKEDPRQFEAFLDDVAAKLIAKGVPAARECVAQSVNPLKWSQQKDTLMALKNLLDAAADTDRRILKTFEAKAGHEAYVDLPDGRKCFLIVRVENDKIVCRESAKAGGAPEEKMIGVGDLALHERLRRMGPDTRPEVALVKGLIALECEARANARDYFGRTHPAIADRLVAAVPLPLP